MRAGRLVAFGVDPTDPSSDYRAHDVGIDGGAASAEEAAIHIIAEEDTTGPVTVSRHRRTAGHQ
jgi:hypothetical protein